MIDNSELIRQLRADAELIAKHNGRSVRVFVKARGQDVFKPNPLIARLEGARARLEANKVVGVIGLDAWRSAVA